LSKILVLDQSFRASGWAIIDTKANKVEACGCIKTKPLGKPVHETDVTTLDTIAKEFTSLIKAYSPTMIIFENPVGSRSARSGQALGMVKGLVIGISISLQIPYEWVTAKQAKKTLTNNRNAEKEEVFKEVCKAFPGFKKMVKLFKSVEVKHAASDAIAVYLCYKKGKK
jgi:Holliday junction resolvasome RuvABC endonuclease subunit